MGNEYQDEPAKSRPSCSRFGLVGCGVTIALLVIGFIAILAIFNNSPYFQGLADCRMQIGLVGAALQRYATKNDTYPDKLSDLVPDYLPAKSLHCPADNPPSHGAISYVYTKQRMDAPDKSVLLTCNYHKAKSSVAPAILKYLKNGHVVLVTPSGDEHR